MKTETSTIDKLDSLTQLLDNLTQQGFHTVVTFNNNLVTLNIRKVKK